MNAKRHPRFDIETLRGLAGAKAFARGEGYARSGQVDILSLEPDRVLAQVAGTEDYRTVLNGAGTRISGECSCPAFADWGFCKHMVAVALMANAAGENGAPEGAGALGRIREHLRAKGVDALVEMILEMAERDAALFRRLDLAAMTVHADEKTLTARLRKVIDGAIRTAGYIEYYEAAGWAADVESALNAVADLAQGRHAGIAIGLIERAMARLEEAMADIDDSDGHCGALLHHARDIHLDACRATRPDPVALARRLFEREMADDYDVFSGAAAIYADVLGEDGLAEYRRLATEAWDKLPPRIGSDRVEHEFSGDYFRLARILDFFAERDGDVEARIAIHAKDLSSPLRYLQLAELCLREGRPDEALRRAEEGLWVLEDERMDERLVFCAVDLLVKAGRTEDAEAHLWRAFTQAPSLELYRRLRTLQGDSARERAIVLLRARMAKERPALRHSPADLLVHVLMAEKMFDAAWATVREYKASRAVKEALAKVSEATHPGEAVAVYAGRVEELAKAGGNPAYEEAAGLIAHMAALRGAAEQAAYVVDLKERFRRKRNFKKLLG